MALTPSLMFTGQAEEAMRFYVSTFPDAEILHLDRYGPDDTGREGTVKGATFRISDQTLRCIDSPDVHAFGFTPAVSFFFDCQDDLQRPVRSALRSGERLHAAGSVPLRPEVCVAQRPLRCLLAAQCGPGVAIVPPESECRSLSTCSREY